jgi:hypothetical protein
MPDNTNDKPSTRTRIMLAAVRGVAEGIAKAAVRWLIDLFTAGS